MEKKSKYILIALITVISFSLLGFFSFWVLTDLETDNGGNGEREKLYQVYNITLKIDYSGEKLNEQYYKINLTDYDTTVFDALDECCNISFDLYGDRIFITEINQIKCGWIYYVNNEFPGIACNLFNLKSNDSILWEHV